MRSGRFCSQVYNSPVKAVLDIDRLIMLIRRELGLDNPGLDIGDLFSVFLEPNSREEMKRALEERA